MTTADDQVLSQLRALGARGRHLEVADRACALLREGRREPALLHLAALSLARSGAPAQATRLLDQYAALCEDGDEEIATLKARLLKDRFRRDGDGQAGRAARDLYKRTFRRTGGYFPAINAATLSLLIGDAEESRALAGEALRKCRAASPANYWTKATESEALLLTGRITEAADALRAASLLEDADATSRNSTYRQLRLLRARLDFPDAVLDPIRPPASAMYSGHMIHGIGRSPGIDPDDADALGADIERALRRERVGFAYGSLACGADILVAEAMLRAGGEVTIVLPFAAELFVGTSVAPAGDDWVRRFHDVMRCATRHIVLAQDPIADHNVLYEMAGRVAMGLARLKAAELDAEAVQVAVQHAAAELSPAGTARDVNSWQALGGRTVTLSPPAPRRSVAMPPATGHPPPDHIGRAVRAMVFADVRGYSALPERVQALLVPRWLAFVQSLRERAGDRVCIVETWGDAAYVVTMDAATAAEIAIDLAALTGGDLVASGEAQGIGLRVSAHAGPLLVTENPALHQQAFFGADVTLAARMEPATPVGEVYVTETFAALLMTEQGHRFRCEYAGVQKLAKGYGEMPLFHLRRT